SRSREKLGQRRFARGDRVGVGRSRLQLSRRLSLRLTSGWRRLFIQGRFESRAFCHLRSAVCNLFLDLDLDDPSAPERLLVPDHGVLQLLRRLAQRPGGARDRFFFRLGFVLHRLASTERAALSLAPFAGGVGSSSLTIRFMISCCTIVNKLEKS